MIRSSLLRPRVLTAVWTAIWNPRRFPNLLLQVNAALVANWQDITKIMRIQSIYTDLMCNLKDSSLSTSGIYQRGDVLVIEVLTIIINTAALSLSVLCWQGYRNVDSLTVQAQQFSRESTLLNDVDIPLPHDITIAISRFYPAYIHFVFSAW